MTAPPEPLASGLSDRYRIERELGQGGMATVYLAHDLKHDRKVAVKVLKPELAAIIGATRFLAEIKVTANLQHPHILPLHDSGEVNGTVFYVMPFVQGESLRDRLTRETQIPIGDAVRIATEVASALEYAHQHGIIHRDIKPENILLHGGHALVADFGIALAATSAGSRMTETGMSLGTPTYMSPEQAMGQRTPDARTDVYALGCVLYEMLTGEPPFSGPTAQSIVAKVMTEKPVPPSNTRDTVPEAVEDAVLSALAKLPADRPASAAAFASMLEGRTGGADGRTGRRADGQKKDLPVRSSSRLPVGVLALATVGFAALAGWALTRGRSEPRDIGFPPAAAIAQEGRFALSPDGKFIIYPSPAGAAQQLWYQNLRGGEARPIPGTEGAEWTPWIEPDGRRIAFSAAGKVRVVSVEGGPVTDIASVDQTTGGAWTEAGSIFFVDSDGRQFRWADPAAGPGRAMAVGYCILPNKAPSDGSVLCGGGAERYGTVVDTAAPMVKRLWRRARRAGGSDSSFVAGSDFRIVEGRYLVYLSLDGALTGARIEDWDSLTVGRPVRLVPGVRRLAYNGAGDFQIGRNGTLVYAPGENGDVGRLVRLGAGGRVSPLRVEPASYLRFSPSPDGRRLASVVEGVEAQELRVHDLSAGTFQTVDRALFIGAPSWSPDGRRLAYRKDWSPGGEGLYLRSLGATGAPAQLLKTAPRTQASSYLADDFLLVGSGDAGAMLINPIATPARIDTLQIPAFHLSISPGRRWIAWQSPGVLGIHLQPWPSLDGEFLVDAKGYEPRWQSDNELVYLGPASGGQQSRSTLWRATLGASRESPIVRSELLHEDARFRDTPGWSLAVMPGGDVVYLQSQGDNLAHYVRVVPDWIKVMKRAVDAANR